MSDNAPPAQTQNETLLQVLLASQKALTDSREMNIQDADGQYYRNDRVWISTALSFMTKDAALWATPYMEEYSLGRPIFGDNWATFEAAFKLHFESIDEKEDAKHRLKALHQDKMMVAEYTAKFKELMGRTGYSMEDLRDRFYDNLSHLQ
ncbi:hypothetical protein VNI00_017955 [Paramarasmius palmivorus]|uniref:Retrotransposon gag domain-containing protein n=1 Tax=Paramarasmius palmivorus TaxID=297713 RepID=A0AAW0B387_9AGAR